MGRPSFCRRSTHIHLVVASRQTRPSGESAGEPKSPDLNSHVVPFHFVFLDGTIFGVEPPVLQCASQLALQDGGLRRPEPGHRLSCPTRSPLREVSSGNHHALQHSNDVSQASPTGSTDARRSNGTRARNTTGLSKAITASMADVHRSVFTAETT